MDSFESQLAMGWALLTLVTIPMVAVGVYASPDITIWDGLMIVGVCLLIFILGQVFLLCSGAEYE